MNVLHISEEYYEAPETGRWWVTPDTLPKPACGAEDGATIRRGSGPGLLRRAAFSSEYHCAACIKALEGRGR